MHQSKLKAISLRRAGKTYAEILAEVPVAKSTLSLWLRSVGLSSPQNQRITDKRIAAARRGAAAKKERRLKEVENFAAQGIKDISSISERELWLIGIALHWAEGAKQNLRSPSAGLMFGNSDPKMIRLYIKWLLYIGVQRENIYFELYCHTSRRSEVLEFKRRWEKELRIQIARGKIYFKNGNIKTNRSNSADLYRGLLRIKVRSSTELNRRIHGWIEGIAKFSV